MPRDLVPQAASHDSDRVPNIVCAIDFGMTCTGVAYQQYERDLGNLGELEVITEWPGGEDEKVPSTIAYDSAGNITSWGLLTSKEEDQSKVKRLWKVNMSSGGQLGSVDTNVVEEACKYFKDYLVQLYEYINIYFDERVHNFKSKDVEYIFSVPTTWSVSTVEKITNLIRESGFRKAKHQWSKVGLTEAEAAAVDVLPTYDQGDVVLVCDAGGGTTDIAVLKKTNSKDDPTQLLRLTTVQGISSGASQIDTAAVKHLAARMTLQFGKKNAERYAWATVRGQTFQKVKHDFGQPWANAEVHTLPVLGIGENKDLPSVGIKNSKIDLIDSDIRPWFDTQVKHIEELIKGQIRKVKETPQFSHEKIKYLVLSGGLCKNAYVRDKLKAGFGLQGEAQSETTNSMEVMLAEKPRLTVVKGLVKDRVQEISRKVLVFDKVCCRESYGIETQERYDKKNPNHKRADVVKERDGREWISHQIDWIIRRGDILPREGITKSYSKFVDPDPREKWTCKIVSTTAPSTNLPVSMQDPAVFDVVEIEADVDELRRTSKKRVNSKLKIEKYEQVEFELRVKVGAASLRFQIHGQGHDGHILSKEHPEVKVRFQEYEEEAQVKKELPFSAKAKP